MDIPRSPARSSIISNKGDGNNNIHDILISVVMRIGAAFCIRLKVSLHQPYLGVPARSAVSIIDSFCLSLSRYAYLFSKRRYFDEGSGLLGTLHSFRRVLALQGLLTSSGEQGKIRVGQRGSV